MKLGSVDGESLDEIVEITTKHGGTHYIVRVDRTEAAEVSNVVIAGVFGAAMVADESRLISATAYRCP